MLASTRMTEMEYSTHKYHLYYAGLLFAAFPVCHCLDGVVASRKMEQKVNGIWNSDGRRGLYDNWDDRSTKHWKQFHIHFILLETRIGTCTLSRNDTCWSCWSDLCHHPVQVGDVLVAIGDGKLKFLDNDVDFRQVLSILETSPRPLYLGFVGGLLGATATSLRWTFCSLLKLLLLVIPGIVPGCISVLQTATL